MIKGSELILNSDGSVYHLHLKPEHIADHIIFAGDPARVDTIAGFFESREFSVRNREFYSVTGWYKNIRFTVISTGIGTDNIDIVMNELDAAVNIDLETRQIKKEKRTLKIIRIGTSGSLQHDIPVHSWVISQKSIGFDGLLNFYANRRDYCDLLFEKAFKQFTEWDDSLPAPYVADASSDLLSAFSSPEYTKGVTISAPGFYAPQGRTLRLPLAFPELNRRIEEFCFEELRISNFEMESSAIYGLSRMLGHEALTVCLIIANRVTKTASEDYRDEMKKLIKDVLDRLTVKFSEIKKVDR